MLKSGPEIEAMLRPLAKIHAMKVYEHPTEFEERVIFSAMMAGVLAYMDAETGGTTLLQTYGSM